MEPAAAPGSPLDVAVLAMLEAGPLHVYGLQQRIQRLGKDAALNVAQRGGLYKAVKRLHAAGLLEVRGTERGGRFPERTLYGLTDAGRRAGREWLTGLLATPRPEFPAFPAALAVTMLLGPAQVLAALERRAGDLRERLAASPPAPGDGASRVAALEREYQRAMLAAEAAWVEAAVADLRSGAFTWGGG